ncbi:MAG: hypothetical protein GX443_04835 [Deltaproteobacteria bacterium]|nr:hypothetical protein [Deltaproteobacteria bacterium]
MALRAEHPNFMRLAARSLAGAIMAAGLLLLVKVIRDAYSGALAMRLFGSAAESPAATLCALGLGLPVPFHVISIGLVLQKRWLSSPWRKAAWICIVTSGFWLGIAVAVKIVPF